METRISSANSKLGAMLCRFRAACFGSALNGLCASAAMAQASSVVLGDFVILGYMGRRVKKKTVVKSG